MQLTPSANVALALRESCPLVTADRRLYNAVKPHLPDAMVWIDEVT